MNFLYQVEAFGFSFDRDLLDCDSIFWSDGDHFSLAGEKRFSGRFDVVQYALAFAKDTRLSIIAIK